MGLLPNKHKRHRVRSTFLYTLMKGVVSILPMGQNAVASALVQRLPLKLQTAVVSFRRSKWVIIPSIRSTWIPAFGLKEPAVHVHLERLFACADAFIDCGANLGWFSLIASQHKNVKHIVAVEPVHQSARFIQFIKKLNNISYLDVLNACISDHDGFVEFITFAEKYSEHGSVVVETQQPNQSHVVRLPSYTLDAVLDKLPNSLEKICIKIDVEGHEKSVIQSLRSKSLLDRINSMLIEVHLYKFSDPLKELEEICGLVSVVGDLEFIIASSKLFPSYQRFFWRLFGSYPIIRKSLPEISELIDQNNLTEIFIIVRRKSEIIRGKDRLVK